MTRLLSLFACCVVAACGAAPATHADHAADPQLATAVRDAVDRLGPGMRAAVWLGGADGPPALAWNVEQPLPCASAIKTAYLVELFDAHAGALDRPARGTHALLADHAPPLSPATGRDAHPAVAHFSAAQRAAAHRALGGASVRRLGEAMIRGNGVDNATYNLAANVVTAELGGPLALTAKLHARAPEWRGLHVRRYMLADRRAHGDNESTAHALAAVHRALATRRVPGVDAATIEACRDVLARAPDALGRAAFAKGGSLDSEPVTRVEAGWREGPTGPTVFVVILVQDGLAGSERAAAGQRLGDAARGIRDLLVARP